jgi:hypothetical protein
MVTPSTMVMSVMVVMMMVVMVSLHWSTWNKYWSKKHVCIRWEVHYFSFSMLCPKTTPLTRVLQKLIITQMFKKFTVFYVAQTLITVFTRARYRPLSCARWIQSTPRPIYLWLSVFYFATSYFFTVVCCSPPAQPSSWCITPCRQYVTAYAIYMQLTPYLEATHCIHNLRMPHAVVTSDPSTQSWQLITGLSPKLIYPAICWHSKLNSPTRGVSPCGCACNSCFQLQLRVPFI